MTQSLTFQTFPSWTQPHPKLSYSTVKLNTCHSSKKIPLAVSCLTSFIPWLAPKHTLPNCNISSSLFKPISCSAQKPPHPSELKLQAAPNNQAQLDLAQRLKILSAKMFSRQPIDDAQVARLALPSIFAVLLEPFINLYDTMFMARLGTEALASLPAPNALIDIIFVIKSGILAVAPAVLSAAAWAKNDKPAVGRVIVTTSTAALTSATIIALALSIPGISEFLIGLFGSPETSANILAMSKQYLLVRLPGVIASCFNMTLEAAFRGMEEPEIVLKGSIAAAIVNFITVPLFIFVLKMGIVGAALGATLSQWAANAVFLFFLYKRRIDLDIHLSNIRKTSYKEIVKFGLSSGPLLIRQTYVIAIYTLMTYLAGGMDIITNAAYLVFAGIVAFIEWMTEPINIASQVMIVQKRHISASHARDFGYRAMGLTIIAALAILAFCIVFFPLYGVQLISGNESITQKVIPPLIFYLVTWPIPALTYVFDSFCYGSEDYAFNTKITTFAVVVGSLVMLASTFAFHGGLMGLVVSVTLHHAIRCVLNGRRLFFDPNGPLAIIHQPSSPSREQELHDIEAESVHPYPHKP